MTQPKILWADDEIEMLKPHIIFLEQKGYSVESVTNGDDAVDAARQGDIDLILLDEMMPGKDGLQALSEIRSFNPSVPIILVTKNEEESLMEEALGQKITDYLTKPVNPSQILLACKKVLEKKKIATDKLTRDYAPEFMAVQDAIGSNVTPQDWIDTYLKITDWSLEVERHPELGFQDTVRDLHRDANKNFCKFVDKNYKNWVDDEAGRPDMSIDVVQNKVIPHLKEGKKVFFIVIDCLRTDQWLTLESMLYDYFRISRDYYYSILPTATPYSRNAIFSGMFPRDIERAMPDLWQKGEEDEHSSNRNEHQFLDELLKRKMVGQKVETRYVKILDPQEAKATAKNLNTLLNVDLSSIVVNFVDILGHKRSESEILQEIAPDEAAYRSLIKSWFEHSDLFAILRTLSEKDVTVVITTDHGAIRGKKPSKIVGDKETSTSVRYKYGRNLKCDTKQVMHIKDPVEYKLPARGINTHYLIAKEDYFLVYPNNYNQYVTKYKDSFQHGGISMDEMILPVVTLEGLKR